MKKKTLVVAAALLAAASAFTITAVANFSDKDDGINRFAVGQVQISAQETNWQTADEDADGVPDGAELLVPYEILAKNPTITNTGEDDAIVFFKVTVPLEALSLIGEDGQKKEEAQGELFWFQQEEDAADLREDHFDEHWVALSALSGEKRTAEVNDEKQGLVYLFGYRTRLSAGETTEALFDRIQNKKYASSTIAANEKETILIEAFAIQADNVPQNDAVMDEDGELTEEMLTDIYAVFSRQTGQGGK